MSHLTQEEQGFFAKKPINLPAFAGTWHIAWTSLDFWRNRFNPTVTYTLNSTLKILDEVKYQTANGKHGIVVGYDTLVRQNGSSFEWIAKPWYLRFLKSTWGVVDHDAEYAQWAVTYFSKTTFTPAGMDVYSRTPMLEKDACEMILAKVGGVEFLKPYLPRLYKTKHS